VFVYECLIVGRSAPLDVPSDPSTERSRLLLSKEPS
jgi:hypothetical protein